MLKLLELYRWNYVVAMQGTGHDLFSGAEGTSHRSISVRVEMRTRNTTTNSILALPTTVITMIKTYSRLPVKT